MITIKEMPGGVRMEVKVQPRSSRNEIAEDHNGVLKVKLTAAPVDGEANQALIKYIASWLKVPKRNIIIIKGKASRNKLLEIRGVNKNDIVRQL